MTPSVFFWGTADVVDGGCWLELCLHCLCRRQTRLGYMILKKTEYVSEDVLITCTLLHRSTQSTLLTTYSCCCDDTVRTQATTTATVHIWCWYQRYMGICSFQRLMKHFAPLCLCGIRKDSLVGGNTFSYTFPRSLSHRNAVSMHSIG